jgi:predicted Zn-dependent peptidase
VKLTDEELAAAKEKNRGPILFSAENPVNVMNYYAKQVLDRPEEVMTFDQVIDRLMQTDSDEVRRVARELFSSKKLNLAIVGPVERERGEKLRDKTII